MRKIILMIIMFVLMTTNIYAEGFWDMDAMNNPKSVLDSNYKFIANDVREDYESLYKVYLINPEFISETTDDIINILILGAGISLYDDKYVDYEFIEDIMYEYGSRFNPNFIEDNPMVGLSNLMPIPSRGYKKEFETYTMFPSILEESNNKTPVISPAIIDELIDMFFEVAYINDEVSTLEEDIKEYMDYNTSANFYHMKNEMFMVIKDEHSKDVLKINFDSKTKNRVKSIIIDSSDPKVIDGFEHYFKNKRNLNEWVMIASGNDYIEFYNIFNGGVRINRETKVREDREQREKEAREKAFAAAGLY